MGGGAASEYYHQISPEEYQAFDPATQAYWDNTAKYQLHILGTHPRDICVFDTNALEADPVNDMALDALRYIWYTTMSGDDGLHQFLSDECNAKPKCIRWIPISNPVGRMAERVGSVGRPYGYKL